MYRTYITALHDGIYIWYKINVVIGICINILFPSQFSCPRTDSEYTIDQIHAQYIQISGNVLTISVNFNFINGAWKILLYVIIWVPGSSCFVVLSLDGRYWY